MRKLKETWRFLKFEYTVVLIKFQRILDNNPEILIQKTKLENIV